MRTYYAIVPVLWQTTIYAITRTHIQTTSQKKYSATELIILRLKIMTRTWALNKWSSRTHPCPWIAKSTESSHHDCIGLTCRVGETRVISHKWIRSEGWRANQRYWRFSLEQSHGRWEIIFSSIFAVKFVFSYY